MFADLQNEINERVLATEVFFDASCRPGSWRNAAIAKGLAFVQLYAIYESTTRSSVRAGMVEIKAAGHAINSLVPELLSLALDSDMNSVVDSRRERHWRGRVELFLRSCSAVPIDVPDTAFPFDGSHFRVGQLETIWMIFGITQPVVPENRLIPLVNELVDHRNAVAHGRSTAEEIGRTYTKDEIKRKISDTRNLCSHIVSTLQIHCGNSANFTR